MHFSTGTGFYISRDGYILTNAHVIDRCTQAVEIVGAGLNTTAEIIWMNKEKDVALLLTREIPTAAAMFRSADMPMREGAPVVIVGHPEGKPLTTYSAKYIAGSGPLGEPQLLQFTSSVYKGNSGGPLLDASGQVIGMVTAKATVYRYVEGRAQNEVVANSDVAIQPYVLQELLSHTGVWFNYNNNDAEYEAHRIEDMAREFVVQVKCQID